MDISAPLEQPKNAEQDSAMLSPLEARILGALMEKQMTTPDIYPLSLNSLLIACNQKTSREPVMTLDEGEVKRCLYQLEERKLIEIEYGSRADKFNQRLSRSLHFEKPEQAIFCIMLLRGSQTVNELLSRTKRMYDFSSSSELDELLDKLLNKNTPLIQLMPQQSGQREARYMHLLCGEQEAVAARAPATKTISKASDNELVARVDELEKQVAWLMEQVKSQD